MRNELRGVDIVNNSLWFARETANQPGIWEGTGLNQAGFTVHMDMRSAIQHYLIAHPETHVIQGVLNDLYRIAIPHNAAATTILDAIVRELIPPDEEQQLKGD